MISVCRSSSSRESAARVATSAIRQDEVALDGEGRYLSSTAPLSKRRSSMSSRSTRASLGMAGLPPPTVTGQTTTHAKRDIRTALEAGADGYLLKDARRAELVRAVGDLAQGKPVLTGEALAVLAGRGTERALTDRELDCLRLIAAGHTNRSVAARMNVSEATVKTHLSHAFDKLGVGDRAAAVRVAYERGIL